MASVFMDRSRWLAATNFSFAILSKYEVADHHTLVIPQREVKSIFDLTAEEYQDLWELVREQSEIMKAVLKCDLNIGVNDGEFAGQSIDHAHIHIIPRIEGDHPNPRGGVRAVIPGKGDYTID